MQMLPNSGCLKFETQLKELEAVTRAANWHVIPLRVGPVSVQTSNWSRADSQAHDILSMSVTTSVALDITVWMSITFCMAGLQAESAKRLCCV
mmetsp:Transcript_10694/g.27666  ORF Transcript_10694/g.27666 Transcript_10694/m.27666 type:complete len:93 (+) Transcript_10694:35-313(+)